MTKPQPKTERKEPEPKEKGDKGEPAKRERKRPRTSLIRGIAIAAIGVLATFLLMANESQIPHGPLWGALTTLLAVVGLLDALGLFTPPSEGEIVPIRETTVWGAPGENVWLTPRATVPLALGVLVLGGAAFGLAKLPWVICGAIAILALSAWRRPGVLVFVVGAAIFLPVLGTYDLWDPWETHYGEVAREILSRDDWISLWWAQENWFWSKPIWIFWSEALSMGFFGVDFHPDANPMQPEWAVRLPVALLAIGAMIAVYAAISKIFNKRAGVLAAIALATTPYFFFLAHQAITDIPFVANMTIAMCLFILALRESPDRVVRSYRIGPFAVSAQHLVLGAIVLVTIPQILYLASRNVTMVGALQFAWHGDRFISGSAGNGSTPGNSPITEVEPYLNGVLAQPMMQALLWAVGLGVIVFLLRKERRTQALYMFAFYLFCAFAFMGKGIPGFALPGVIALFYLIASKRWSIMLDGQLRIASGVLVLATVGLPWFVAMYMRHGPPFTDRLLVHDHLNRLASGVHGDTGSIEYFLEQLGVGLFPWVALAPAALTAWLHLRSAPSTSAPAIGASPYREQDVADPDAERAEWHRAETLQILALWFTACFVLFNAMITKFHHYIFPVAPPTAIAVGILLDRMFGPHCDKRDWRSLGAAALAFLSPVPFVLGIAGLRGDVRGILPANLTPANATDWALHHPWGTGTCVALLVLAAAMLLGSGYLFWIGARETRPHGQTPWDQVALGAALVGAPIVAAFVGRDLSWVTQARPAGYERLIQLFIYNYGRPWPEQLDYRPILTGFAVVTTLCLALAAIRTARPIASRALVGVALMFAAWCLDVYIVDLSPHWGQRTVIKRYYEERSGPNEPLIAWQMNWKGENFYTGNRAAVFVDLDNRKLREWIEHNHGRRVFAILEHSRLANFKTLVPGHEVREITTKRDNNKFVVVTVVL